MKRLTIIIALFGLLLNAAAQQWVLNYGEIGFAAALNDGIQDAQGNNFMVGIMGELVDNSVLHDYPYILRSDAFGNIESRYFAEENHCDIKPIGCIQLNNGNYFVACREMDTITNIYNHLPIYTHLEIIILNQDLEIVSEKRYAIDTIADNFNIGQLLLDDDGTVVLCGSYVVYHSSWYPHRPAFYRFDEEGNILASRYAQPDEQSDEYWLWLFECYQLMKNPKSDGYLIIGQGASGTTALIFYDRQFNYVDDIEIEIETGRPVLYKFAHSDLWLSDDEMLLLGFIYGALDLRYETIGLLRLKTDGTIIQCDTLCHRVDTNTMVVNKHGMVYVNDTTIFGAYFAYDQYCYPVYSGLCLFDKDMELLGSKFFSDEEYYDFGAYFLLPTSDGSCIVSMSDWSCNPDKPTGKIVKMRREDFNPIPCGVHKVPKQQLQASVFPNPAKDEVHFDISVLPQDGENRICITDNLGRTRMNRIIRGEGNLLTIGVSSLEPGIYTYVIYNSQNELLNGKFVKE